MSCEFSPFPLSICTLIRHWKLQNNVKIFLIFCKKGTVWKDGTFCKKGTVWKDGTFFEENNVPFSNYGQIGAQNPKIILMSFLVLCTMMKGNSVLISTACQTKYLFYINLGKCHLKNQRLFISSILATIKKSNNNFIFWTLILDSKL